MGLDDDEANGEVVDLENKEAWAKRKASTMTVGSQRGGSALVSTREGIQVVNLRLSLHRLSFVSNTCSSQTNAIKEFYENTDTQDMTKVDRLIWVTKFGMPACVLIFVIVYWVIGYLKYQSG